MELTVDALELERQEILKRYRRLLRLAKPFLRENDAKLIKKAFQISAEAHKDMRRKSGEPYIYHPLAVAQICVEEIGLGTTSIIAALLHDVVEDTEFTLDDIGKLFGDKISRIIDGLTKIDNVADQTIAADGEISRGNSMQAENFRKVLMTLSDDVRIILIKIADRLHNMRTLDSMARNKQLKIAAETSFIYAPLAHRLGLYIIKSELEDLYLKYTDRALYDEIARKISETKAARDKFIKDFIAPIEQTIRDTGLNCTIKGRPKSINSIHQKMTKQQIPFEKIYDLFAIRIILEDVKPEDEKSACWRAYSIITDFYTPSTQRLRDWVSTPRANGYESLHTTVMSKNGQWVEVQIRTRRMDDIAEKGYAAHWKYKDQASSAKIAQESGLEMWLNQVRDMLEQNNASAIEFLDEFKSNLFKHEIYVFTPKGDLKVLPAGSTVLDFAFEVHSQVGEQCIGGKISGKLEPISYKLQNGDQIEILTSKNQKPNEDWLRFVISSKAKGKIREVLRDEKRQFMKAGREMVDKKFRAFHIEPGDDAYNELKDYLGEKNPADMLYKFGKGYLDIELLKKYKEHLTKPQQRIQNAKQFEKIIRKANEGKEGIPKDVLLIGDELDFVEYTLAPCCKPISGDDVFGYTSGNVIKVHRTTCPNASELMAKHGERVIKAQWASKVQTAYDVLLRLTGTDRVGLVKDVTKILSEDLQVNMTSINIAAKGTLFEGLLGVKVFDTKHLLVLLEKLHQVEGILGVERVIQE